MTFELIHRKESDKFKTGMDVQISIDGDIAVIEDKKELLQSIEKAIVTNKQSDGYGTNLYKLRGTKNKDVVKTLGILTLLETLQLLKTFQIIAYSLNRTSIRAVLNSVKRVSVNVLNQTISYVVTIVDNNDVVEDINNVVE